jgi:predicted transport protein
MKGGFRDSPLRLNGSLREVQRWNEDAIVKRAAILSEKALNIWLNHDITQESQQEQKVDWTLDDHHHLTGEMLDLFQQIRLRILNLDASISEKINKYEIVYKANTKFAEIQPQAKQLRLWLKLPIGEIDDPLQKCQSRTNYPKWVQVGVTPADELDYIIALMYQAYDKRRADEL